MPTKRTTLLLTSLFLVLFWSGAAGAQGKTYLLGSGSGAQVQIGNGLPLPIQVTMTNPTAPTRDWQGSGPVASPLICRRDEIISEWYLGKGE